jgi:2-polyprenyl-3-methyl-5-hydroxy-6-metoxy-1,4-benzoquinol methylase
MRSNVEWKAWGKHDPLFAVSSWKGKGKYEAMPWTNEEFYSLGEKDWTDFKKRWAAYGLAFQHCLEIGCGAGRITKQLANDFEHVTALDVSDDQIAYAKTHVTSQMSFSS